MTTELARYYVPSRTLVVIAGDTTAAEARPLVEEAFRGYKGPPTPSLTEPLPAPRPRTITLVDRPGSVQSDIQAALLVPGGADPRRPALVVLNRVLGGKGTGRLFLEVREKQGLAYRPTSQIIDRAVTVVDPKKGFTTIRTLPANPQAALQTPATDARRGRHRLSVTLFPGPQSR